MKNLSNRELVDDLACDCECNARNMEYENKLKAELLRRLEAGDRAIQACREIAAMELEGE